MRKFSKFCRDKIQAQGERMRAIANLFIDFFCSAIIILEYFRNFHLLYHHRRTRIDILYVKQHVLIQNRLSFSFAMGPRSLGPKHK